MAAVVLSKTPDTSLIRSQLAAAYRKAQEIEDEINLSFNQNDFGLVLESLAESKPRIVSLQNETQGLFDGLASCNDLAKRVRDDNIIFYLKFSVKFASPSLGYNSNTCYRCTGTCSRRSWFKTMCYECSRGDAGVLLSLYSR